MIRTLLLFALAMGLAGFPAEKKDPRPNIVLIFMDDLGYGDLSCYGALNYRTPHLDQLAMEGMRFTNFLAAQAVCSASRVALLTGCYPNRVGFWGAYGPNAQVGIADSEVTLAELLQQEGYATGIFGKWHLGDQRQFLPLQHGFQEYLGLPYSNDMWPVDYGGLPATDWRKSNYPALPLLEGNEVRERIETLADQAKLTTLYTERAVDFIDRHAKEPFLLYVPHSMPHVPIAVSERFRGKSGYGLWGDLMMEIDWSVGEIMQALQRNKLAENTLVIFTSDNGPWLNFGNHAGTTGGLREGKGTSYEGGHRVPCIMRWPGHIPAGVVTNALASTIDVFPTVASLCAAELPTNRIDGIDLSRLIQGDLEAQPRRYFAYYYRRNSLEAVRRDHWKLVFPHRGRTYQGFLPGNDGYPGPAPEDHTEPLALFDLRRDPGETYDVQLLYSEIVRELQEYAEQVRADLGDDLTGQSGTGRREIGRVDR
ncbi:MAG: sulfatase [Lewinellaceae bacterium]|nr:sulfatase [Lewinellaceae bacterium]